jgi:hypothetical protein
MVRRELRVAAGHDFQFRQVVALWLLVEKIHCFIVRNRNFSSEMRNRLNLSYRV